jgi:hypothetical protein
MVGKILSAKAAKGKLGKEIPNLSQPKGDQL